jgi:hypothetical protein
MIAIQEIITVINSVLFNSNKKKESISKISPSIDIEMGEHIKDDYKLLTNNNKLQNPDLELGFGPIVEIDEQDIIIDIRKYNYTMIEDYISFIDSIHYLSLPLKDRNKIPLNISFIFNTKDNINDPLYT